MTPLYDVFVLGAEAPGGDAGLAEALASQSGQPLPAIARALADKKLRVGHRVAREIADKIAYQMRMMGAVTTITPIPSGAVRASGSAALSNGAPPPAAPGGLPTPMNGFPAANAAGADTQKGHVPLAGAPTAAGRFTLTPLSAAAVATRPTPVANPTLRPLSLSAPAATPVPAPPPAPALPTTFALNEVSAGDALPSPVTRPADGAGSISGTYEVPSAISSFALPATPAPRDPFAVPETGDKPLELELSRSGPPTRQRPSASLPGASALNIDKLTATSSSSGLALSDLTNGGNMERCRTHQLLYDPRKSKGCRKCGELRRASTHERVDGPPAATGLRAQPGKRAFMGLALALAVGFVPAAYYAIQPGSAEVTRLRAEQTQLSERAGTEEILRRFDEIEVQVDASRMKVMRNTLFLWLGTGGVVLLGFYRVS